jgi:AraC-like DNA-binding protein
MKDEVTRELPLSKMAQLVNLSTPRLYYLFKAETGTSPARYLKSLRMGEAAMLLSNTFLSVKEIMARVGFSDASHFVRDFKRTFGATPTDYRNGNLINRQKTRRQIPDTKRSANK